MGIDKHKIPQRFLIYLGALSTHKHALDSNTKRRRLAASSNHRGMPDKFSTVPPVSTDTASAPMTPGTPSKGTILKPVPATTVLDSTSGTSSTMASATKKVDRKKFKMADQNTKWSVLTADELDQQLLKTPDITCPTCMCNLDDGDQVIRVAQEHRKINDNGLRHQPCFENELRATDTTGATGANTKKGKLINPGEYVAGTMTWSIENDACYSHIVDSKEKKKKNHSIIKITYKFKGPDKFENKKLRDNRKNPRDKSGRYKTFDAYLPNSMRGRKILNGLMKAFQQSKDITIATSNTTLIFGVTYGPLHFRTDPAKNSIRGYPSDSWYKTAQNELGAQGIFICDDDNSTEANVSSGQGVLKRGAKRS